MVRRIATEIAGWRPASLSGCLSGVDPGISHLRRRQL